MDSHGERLLSSESGFPWYCESADQEPPGKYSPRSAHGKHNKPAAKLHWPWFIWFLLKLIGLFNRRPAVARRRLCLGCRLAATERRCVIKGEGVPGYLYPGARETEEVEEEEEGTGDWQAGITESRFINEEAERGDGDEVMGFVVSGDPCVVCQSEWWDAHGRYRPYTDAEIGVKRWNHRGSALLSVIWQILLIFFNMVHYIYYFVKYWGKADQKVDLVIYTGFVLFVVSIPALCLTANVINMLRSWHEKCGSYSWSNALAVRYIVKRLQHLGLRERGLPYKAFLLVCFLWPLGNSTWRFVVFYVIFEDTDSLHVNISLVACTISTAIWGFFCYLVALMRLSFQRQLQIELAFLRKHNGSLDRCRRRLTSCMEDFGSLGSLAAIWIMFTIAVSTWAIATQIYYDYAIYDSTHNMTSTKFSTVQELDRLIWSEITMFLLLPLVAVGGLNLNGLWLQFRQRIGELRLGDRGRMYDRSFCDKILAYCTEHPPVRNIETTTLLVSALGLCLAVEFKERSDLELFHH